MKKPENLFRCLVMLGGITTLYASVTWSKADWESLFNGTDLQSWRILGNANWKLQDNSVAADSGSGYLVSRKSYGDFQLKVEFRVDAEANSGVFIRCADPREIRDDNCYEINIFDRRPDPAYRTGGIVNIAQPTAQMNAANKWNVYMITAIGPRLLVELNGNVTVDTEDTKFREGPIALQYGKGTVEFRNVQIMPLSVNN